MDQEAAQAVETKTDKPKRESSTIGWPYNDLNDAVAIARTVWENVGTSTCDLAQLAAWAGHDTVDSGAFRLRVTAARTFGLITTGSKQVALTDMGRAVVDPDRAAQARVEAFLTVPLYRRLYDRYKGINLPTTSVALEADLADLGVAEKQKDRARQVFQRSAEQAGFFAQGRNRLVLPAFRQEEDRRGGSGGGAGGGSGSGSGAGGGDAGGVDLDPMVKLLVGSLPRPGTTWARGDRQKWIKLAEAAFDVVYREPEVTTGPSAPPLPDARSLSSAQD